MSQFEAFVVESKPSEAEIRVIEASRDGEGADLSELPEHGRRVSSALLVALATGKFAHTRWPEWKLHAVGLSVSGGIVLGDIDLSFQALPTSFRLYGCKLQAVSFVGATVAGDLFLDRCSLSGPCALASVVIGDQFSAEETEFKNTTGDAIHAQGAKATGWFMRKTKVRGRFNINSAQLSGQFVADDAEFENPEGDAVLAHGTKAAAWFMIRAKVKGRFNVTFAQFSGQFVADHAEFENPGGDAMSADGAKAAALFMDRAKVRGRFDVNNIELSGQFSANNAEFENPAGTAISAQGTKATRWLMRRTKLNGQFNISSAELSGHFSADDTEFENPEGDALIALNVRARDWFMNRAKVRGQFRVSSSKFSGQFGAEDAVFENGSDFAIVASYASFEGGIFLRAGTNIIGGVSLESAHVRKVLDFSRASINASDRPAMNLRDLVVEGDATFHGTATSGCLDSSRAHFTSRLSLRTARLDCAARAEGFDGDYQFRHYALLLREVRVDGRLTMPETRPEGIVDLSHGRCGILDDSSYGWPAALTLGQAICNERLCLVEDGQSVDIQHLVLDGFRYGHFEHPDGRSDEEGDPGKARKRWLASQAAGDLAHRFNPQPWRQAAAVLRDMGYDEAAKSVSIERRDRERSAMDAPRTQRWVNWWLRTLADYGYNPKKTVFWCLGVIALCTMMYWGGTQLCGGDVPGALACNGQPLFIETQWGTVAPETIDANYPRFDPLSYSLGSFVPLFDLGSEGYWRANADAGIWFEMPIWLGPPKVEKGAPNRWAFTLSWSWGLTFYWLFIFERIVGGILIAIAITGFTGFLTRDER